MRVPLITARALPPAPRPALTPTVEMAARYPAPDLTLDPHARAVLEAPRLGCEPGTSRAVIDELKAADRPARDSHRYDPARLLPSSARVRQVRVERLRLRGMGEVAELLERIAQLVEVA